MKRLLLLKVIFLSGCDFDISTDFNSSSKNEIYLNCELTRHWNGGEDSTKSLMLVRPEDTKISLYLDTSKRLFISDGQKAFGYGNLNSVSTLEISKTKIKYQFQDTQRWVIDRVTLEATNYLNTTPEDLSSSLRWDYNCEQAEPI